MSHVRRRDCLAVGAAMVLIVSAFHQAFMSFAACIGRLSVEIVVIL